MLGINYKSWISNWIGLKYNNLSEQTQHDEIE